MATGADKQTLRAARQLRHRADQLRKMADKLDATADQFAGPGKADSEVAVQHGSLATIAQGEAGA